MQRRLRNGKHTHCREKAQNPKNALVLLWSRACDVIAVNLDHYRLDADYKHGMHFTALPTAWVSGFDKNETLKIGSSTARTTDTPSASAGFLERILT